MKISNKTLIKIGILGVIIGLGIISISYFSAKRDYAYEFMYNELFSPNETSEEAENIIIEETKNQTTTETKNEKKKKKEQTPSKNKSTKATDNYYIGKLEIPKIGLKRGFYNVGNRYNSIEYNVTMVSGSNLPDVVNGNLILMAHSGDAYISYFAYLYRLHIGDMAYVTYKGRKYQYKIVNIYEVPKNGIVTIKRNKSRTTLTMITCTKNNDHTQTIYISELVG